STGDKGSSGACCRRARRNNKAVRVGSSSGSSRRRVWRLAPRSHKRSLWKSDRANGEGVTRRAARRRGEERRGGAGEGGRGEGEGPTRSDEFARCRPLARHPDRLNAPSPRRRVTPLRVSASLLRVVSLPRAYCRVGAIHLDANPSERPVLLRVCWLVADAVDG